MFQRQRGFVQVGLLLVCIVVGGAMKNFEFGISGNVFHISRRETKSIFVGDPEGFICDAISKVENKLTRVIRTNLFVGEGLISIREIVDVNGLLTGEERRFNIRTTGSSAKIRIDFWDKRAAMYIRSYRNEACHFLLGKENLGRNCVPYVFGIDRVLKLVERLSVRARNRCNFYGGIVRNDHGPIGFYSLLSGRLNTIGCSVQTLSSESDLVHDSYQTNGGYDSVGQSDQVKTLGDFELPFPIGFLGFLMFLIGGNISNRGLEIGNSHLWSAGWVFGFIGGLIFALWFFPWAAEWSMRFWFPTH